MEILVFFNSISYLYVRIPKVEMNVWGMTYNQIIGSIGIEKYNQIGLSRSLAVDSKFINQKVGERLIQYLLDFCINEKITGLYLLTTTAEKYFDKFGFHKIERNNVPEKIVQTREFNDICPLSAVVMKKKL
jgi:amino-acid N-acetyltransferase